MQISKHIHALKIPFAIPLPSGQEVPRTVYAFLVFGGETVLVDSGVAGCEGLLFDHLQALGKKPASIDRLLFTHAHPDHIGAARSIAGQCACTTAAHGAAKAWIEDVDLQFAQRPVPGFHTLVAGSVSIDHPLADGEVIDLGDISLEIMHTPGHSQDSISLFCPEDGVLISGDAVPHPEDLPIYEDPAASVQSIGRLQRIENIRVLLSSWCAPDLRADPMRLLEEGAGHLQRIHGLVRSVAGRQKEYDPMLLCREMVQRLGLPEAAVNPLLARSFAAHLPLLDRKTL